MLSRQQAREFYDRLGGGQDSQGWYEDLPLKRTIEESAFPEADRVVEFGCGTGRFAEKLLTEFLPPHASYLGMELSETMAELARRRLARFGDRAKILLTDGSPQLDAPPHTVDRVVSNYVLDLLSESDIDAFLAEAHRILRPRGLLSVTGLTRGDTALSRLTSFLWKTIHRFRPVWVGGCRPLDLRPHLAPPSWEIRCCETVVSSLIPSQVLVASPRPEFHSF